MSLSPLDSSRTIRKFLVYDLEWIPGTLEVRLVGVYDGSRYRCYTSVENFLASEMTSRNRGKWFYAHAGGLADVQFVLESLIARGGYQVQASFSGSSAIIVKVARGKNAWHFVDSYWLLRDKLKNIAKWIGLEKGGGGFLEADLDLDEEGLSDAEFESRKARLKEFYRSAPLEQLIEYNANDCKILWHAIKNFELALLEMGGQLQKTQASSAMQLFRRRYLKREIPTDDSVNEVARQAYTASRVEVLQESVKDAYYYDINSSFPYAMTFPCPGECLGSSRRMPDNDSIYIADVEIEVPEAFLTTVPLRVKGRVFFPSGRWRAWLTSVDIRLLEREGGRVVRHFESMSFEPFHDLSEYATDLYAKRKASTDDFERIVLKLLLNSLYGKFAESPRKRGLVIDPKEINDSMLQLMPGVWITEKEVPIPHMHVPISAHITAIARQTIYDFMSSCSEVHYCDTDGFSTTDELSTGKELGALKLEKRAVDGRFVAPKVYSLVGEIQGADGWRKSSYYKAKGFSRMTASRFARILEGEAIEFERMARIREIYRKGQTRPEESVITKRLQIRSMYSPGFDQNKHLIPKRFTYPDGKTRPWQFKEIKELIK